MTLLNLCLLLPVLAIAWRVRRMLAPWATEPEWLPFPMAAWRLDAVLILIVGAVLLPVALGRWKLGRTEGVVLVVVYAAYLGASSVLGVSRPCPVMWLK